jgi:hypothetical protein
VTVSTLRLPLTLGLAAIVIAILSLWASSLPGGEAPIVTFLVVVAWALTASTWLVALGRRWRKRNGPEDQPRASWLLVPAVTLVTLAVVVSGLPVRARFAMSLSGVEGLAARAPSYDVSSPAGLYEVCCFEHTDFGYRFGVSDTGLTVWGFAYSPNGPPPGPEIADSFADTLAEGGNAYHHLDGPWYVWQFRYS